MRQKKEKWKREAHGERGGMREVEVKGEERAEGRWDEDKEERRKESE